MNFVLFLLGFLLFFSFTDSCFITNCPPGGKRSIVKKQKNFFKQYLSCETMTFVDQSQVNELDFLLPTVCKMENLSSINCKILKPRCGPKLNGFCNSSNMCCENDNCFEDKNCYDLMREHDKKLLSCIQKNEFNPFLIQPDFQKELSISHSLILDNLKHINDTNLINLNYKFIEDYEKYSQFEIEFCSEYTLIISALSCYENKDLYKKIQEFCKSTLVMSLISPTCERPTVQQGIAFPIIKSENENYISLLIDLKSNLLYKWKDILMVYDDQLDDFVINSIIYSVETINEPGVEKSKITKLPLYSQYNKQDIEKKSLDNVFSYIKENDSSNNILIGTAKIINDFIIKAYEQNLLVNPRKWIVIYTDYFELDLFLSKIISSSGITIVHREFKNEVCEPRVKGCQFKLLIETFHQALNKVIDNNEYNFNNHLKLKTKNRMVSEMTIYLDSINALKSNQNNFKKSLDLKSNNINDELNNELRKSLYCGICDYFLVKSFERKNQKDKIKRKNIIRNLNPDNWVERLTVWKHSERIFYNEKNRHPVNLDKESIKLLNYRLNLRPLEKNPSITKSLADIKDESLEKLNNIYGVHKKKIVKRSVDYHEVKIETRASWQPFKGLLQVSNDPVLMNTGSLSGKHLRIGIVSQTPIINVEIDSTGGCIVNGSTYELINVLREQLNFTYEWVCSKKMNEEGIGYYDDQKQTWNGLLGMIAKKKIDLAANGIYKTKQRVRSKIFTYTIPYDEEVIKVLVKKTPENDEWLFLTPFTYDTWYAVLLSVVLVGPLLYWVNKSSKYYVYYNENDGERLFKLGNCIWYTFGAIVQQGGDNLPNAISGRLLIAFWWLFEIVTIATYSGNLVALLTFPKIIQPIENVEDLLSYHWTMDWAIGKGTQIEEVLKTLKYGQLTKLKPEMNYLDFEKNREKIFEKVASGSLGYIMSEHEARYWISKKYNEQNWCGMFVAKEPIYRAPLHLVLSKDQPEELMKVLNKEIYYCTRSGLTIYWKRNYEVLEDDCMYTLIVHAGDVKKISYIHMIGSFYLLKVGLALSFVVLVLEYLYHLIIQRGNLKFLFNRDKFKLNNFSDDNMTINYLNNLKQTSQINFKNLPYIPGRDTLYPNYLNEKKIGFWTKFINFLCCKSRIISSRIDSADERRQFFDSNLNKYSSNVFTYYSTGNQLKIDEAVMRSWANLQKIPTVNQYNLSPNFQPNFQFRPKVNNNIYNSQYSTVYSNLVPNYNLKKDYNSFIYRK
uniref:Ionotropic receptor 93a n=1 Tax=Polyphagotarsonemus latus TaxID=1204166 RepID=A0AAN0N6H9_9ACAR